MGDHDQLKAARALAEDARQREARAAELRAEAERVHAKAKERHADAVAKSAADPDNDSLLDAVGREHVRVSHAATALSNAKSAHEAVAGEVRDATARVDAAQRELAKAEVIERRNERRFRLRELGANLFAKVLSLATDAAAARKLLADDADDVAALAGLGVTALACDGLPIAAGVVQAALGAKVAVRNTNGVTSARWASQHLQPKEPASRVSEFIVALVGIARTAGQAKGDQADVQAEVESWSGYATFAEATSAKTAAEARARTPPHLLPVAVAEAERIAQQDARNAEANRRMRAGETVHFETATTPPRP